MSRRCGRSVSQTSRPDSEKVCAMDLEIDFWQIFVRFSQKSIVRERPTFLKSTMLAGLPLAWTPLVDGGCGLTVVVSLGVTQRRALSTSAKTGVQRAGRGRRDEAGGGVLCEGDSWLVLEGVAGREKAALTCVVCSRRLAVPSAFHGPGRGCKTPAPRRAAHPQPDRVPGAREGASGLRSPHGLQLTQPYTQQRLGFSAHRCPGNRAAHSHARWDSGLSACGSLVAGC